jgi:hypothetical protein
VPPLLKNPGSVTDNIYGRDMGLYEGLSMTSIWDNKIGTRTGLDLNIKNGYLIKNIKKLKRIIFY